MCIRDSYLDFGGRAYLDEDGQWQEKPEDGSQIISLEDLMDVNPWDDAKAFHYTVEDAVSYTHLRSSQT